VVFHRLFNPPLREGRSGVALDEAGSGGGACERARFTPIAAAHVE